MSDTIIPPWNHTIIPPWIQQRLDELQDSDFTKCRSWLANLPEGEIERLEKASPPTGLGSDPSHYRSDLQGCRSRLAQLNSELKRVSAPANDEFRVKVESWIARRASRVHVDTSGGRCEPSFVPDSPLALFCLIAPSLVADAIVKSAGSDQGAQLAADRARQQAVARIKSEMRAVEQTEEEIIRRMMKSGIAALRRIDASPVVMLGIDEASVRKAA